jgi:pimeloyl-ACP methyl ester carboxylesterase
MPMALNLEGYRCHYEVLSRNGATETVLLAHGNGNCIKDWKALGYLELFHNEHVILMDALGYGESDKPYQKECYTAERRAQDVIAVLDDMGMVDPVHFFGSSIGGSLGFVLAELYPERFKSFLIGSAHPWGTHEPIGSNLFPKMFRDLMLESGMKGFIEELEKKYLGCPFHEMVRPNYLNNDPIALAAANDHEWKNRGDVLSKIAVPVLLFAGDQDPVSHFQEKIANEIPNAQVVILENTDHAGSYWHSKKIADPMRQFFEKNFGSVAS